MTVVLAALEGRLLTAALISIAVLLALIVVLLYQLVRNRPTVVGVLTSDEAVEELRKAVEELRKATDEVGRSAARISPQRGPQ